MDEILKSVSSNFLCGYFSILMLLNWKLGVTIQMKAVKATEQYLITCGAVYFGVQCSATLNFAQIYRAFSLCRDILHGRNIWDWYGNCSNLHCFELLLQQNKNARLGQNYFAQNIGTSCQSENKIKTIFY